MNNVDEFRSDLSLNNNFNNHTLIDKYSNQPSQQFFLENINKTMYLWIKH